MQNGDLQKLWSAECRRKRKSNIMKGKTHLWSGEAKKRLSKKGQCLAVHTPVEEEIRKVRKASKNR